MYWKNFWNKYAQSNNLLQQVGRTLNGKNLSDEILIKTTNYIIEKLEITKEKNVLDVCCGNGLITKQIAHYCNEITGVDFSEKLIETAIKNKKLNTTYICENALEFSLNQTFDVIFIAFSFQYFESNNEAATLIKNCLNHLKNGGKLLLTDVPDANKFFSFYNTTIKLISYIVQILKNKNKMGRFWHKKEILNLCDSLGVKGEIIKQQYWQPYHHYRFDILITK
ncbi:MAG: class I SAM-dependent methyltransferase [Bacteroidia bacterium]